MHFQNDREYTILERLDDVLSSLESKRKTESCRIYQNGSTKQGLFFKTPRDNKFSVRKALRLRISSLDRALASRKFHGQCCGECAQLEVEKLRCNVASQGRRCNGRHGP